MKNWNDNQAMKSLADGVTWDACGFENGKEVRKEVTAGPLCREVLQDVFAFLPAMQLSPASVEDGTTTGHQGGRPHGYQQWTAGLKGVNAGIELQAWQEEVSECSRRRRILTNATLIILGASGFTERRHATRGRAHSIGETGPTNTVLCKRASRFSTTGEVHRGKQVPVREPSEGAR